MDSKVNATYNPKKIVLEILNVRASDPELLNNWR